MKAFFITIFLALPTVVLAGGRFGLDDTASAAELDGYSGTIQGMLGNVVGALLSLIGIVFFVLIVYGGLMWMTARGNQEQVKKALNTVISAAIGLIVVLSAYAITNFVLDSVGPAAAGSGNTSPVTDNIGNTTVQCGDTTCSDQERCVSGTCEAVCANENSPSVTTDVAECMARSSCTSGNIIEGQCPGAEDWICCSPV